MPVQDMWLVSYLFPSASRAGRDHGSAAVAAATSLHIIRLPPPAYTHSPPPQYGAGAPTTTAAVDENGDVSVSNHGMYLVDVAYMCSSSPSRHCAEGPSVDPNHHLVLR